MEFHLKLMNVMEKSWNFEIMTKSHGKVMEFDNECCMSTTRRRYAARKSHQLVLCSFCTVMEFCHMIIEKSWNFFTEIS